MTSKKTTQKEDNKKAKWNNSTLFLSPMFESILRGRQLHGFCSLYLGDHEHNTQHKNAIYALFKPNFNPPFSSTTPPCSIKFLANLSSLIKR